MEVMLQFLFSLLEELLRQLHLVSGLLKTCKYVRIDCQTGRIYNFTSIMGACDVHSLESKYLVVRMKKLCLGKDLAKHMSKNLRNECKSSLTMLYRRSYYENIRDDNQSKHSIQFRIKIRTTLLQEVCITLHLLQFIFLTSNYVLFM